MTSESTPKLTSGQIDTAYLIVLTALIDELKRTERIDGDALAQSIERVAGAVSNADKATLGVVEYFKLAARTKVRIGAPK